MGNKYIEIVKFHLVVVLSTPGIGETIHMIGIGVWGHGLQKHLLLGLLCDSEFIGVKRYLGPYLRVVP
jgi:hypothetical protein